MHSPETPFSRSKEPCWIVPFERNPHFVDRELLGKIKRKLFASRRMERIAIAGLGGVGKTQISLELVFQAKEMYPDCAVFWVPAVDMESVQQSYLQIASQLGIENPGPIGEDVKGVVQKHLSRPQSGRWFLIFDSADDISMWTDASPDSKGGGLRGFLPQSEQGVIMFTTRSNKVAQYLRSTEIIEIPEMDEHKATKVLKNLLVNKSLLKDEENTRKLLERLTYLPLAIVQAASFINENMMSISSYVQLLDGQAQDMIDLLSQEFEDEGRYQSIRNPVATTWLTSFDQIRRLNALAFEYLAFMACVRPKDIPISLLPFATPVEREKALGLLSSYSFVRSHRSGSRLDMHRLVQLATTNWLKSVNALQMWHSYALQHVSWHHPPYHPIQRDEWRAALPHALQVLHLTSNALVTPERAVLLCTVGLCQYEDGRYKEAVDVLLSALDIFQAISGRDHRHSLIAHEYLGRAYQGLGELEKATQMFEEILELRKRRFGPDCVETNGTMEQLASAYRLSEDLESAEQLGIQVVRYYLKAEQPESPNTIRAISGLTLTYLAQGRLSNAGELAEQSLAIQTKVFGPDHINTTSAMTSLADIYMERWRLEKAEDLYAKAIEKATKILGPEHPIILRGMNQMAWILKLQKRHSEALALMTECVRLRTKSLGPNHYQTVDSHECIKDWTNQK